MEEFPPIPAKNSPTPTIDILKLIAKIRLPNAHTNNAAIIDFLLPYLSL